MTVVKRVGVLSLAKIYAVISALVGFIWGLLVMALASFLASLMPGGGATLQGGVFAIILGVIGGAILGFIGGAIIAFLYNLAAGWVGGVEIELS